MSQIKTQRMGRIMAAGSKEKIDEVLGIIAKLNAIHFIEYNGLDEGFDLGVPKQESEIVGKRLNKLRSAASIVNFAGPKKIVPADEVRSNLESSLSEAVDRLLQMNGDLEDVSSALSSSLETKEMLEMLSSLDIDIELLSGYNSLSSFVGVVSGSVSDIELDIEDGSISGIFMKGFANGANIVAIFVENKYSNQVQTRLNQSGFQSINIPENLSGNPSEILFQLSEKVDKLMIEKTTISNRIESWADEFGPSLACGLGIIERDHHILTAPVKIAVSEHAFLIDGWLNFHVLKRFRMH